MTDLVQIQKDLVVALKSSPLLALLPVYSYREKRLAQELDYRKLLTSPRTAGGPVGAGAIVLMPTGSSGNPNVTGPVLDWLFPVVVQEMDAVNMSSGGTQVAAEDWAQRVMDALHLEADQKYGVLRVVGRALQPETEYVFPGCIGYRTTFAMTAKSAQTGRCAAVVLDPGDDRVVAMTCATEGAVIYYTLDGEAPSFDAAASPTSSVYTGPVPVPVGAELRAAAFGAGLNKSATVYYT